MEAETDGHVHAIVRWARRQPRVRRLLETLPALSEATDGSGLFVEYARAPWSTRAGEVRVSVLRVLSVPRAGDAPVVVGQVHAVQSTGFRSAERALRPLAHPSASAPEEAGDWDAWWVHLLDRHYALGGEPAALGTPAAVRA